MCRELFFRLFYFVILSGVIFVGFGFIGFSFYRFFFVNFERFFFRCLGISFGVIWGFCRGIVISIGIVDGEGVLLSWEFWFFCFDMFFFWGGLIVEGY